MRKPPHGLPRMCRVWPCTWPSFDKPATTRSRRRWQRCIGHGRLSSSSRTRGNRSHEDSGSAPHRRRCAPRGASGRNRTEDARDRRTVGASAECARDRAAQKPQRWGRAVALPLEPRAMRQATRGEQRETRAAESA
jgi:hypothetical protein